MHAAHVLVHQLPASMSKAITEGTLSQKSSVSARAVCPQGLDVHRIAETASCYLCWEPGVIESSTSCAERR